VGSPVLGRYNGTALACVRRRKQNATAGRGRTCAVNIVNGVHSQVCGSAPSNGFSNERIRRGRDEVAQGGISVLLFPHSAARRTISRDRSARLGGAS
jgi:hypothetical protein